MMKNLKRELLLLPAVWWGIVAVVRVCIAACLKKLGLYKQCSRMLFKADKAMSEVVWWCVKADCDDCITPAMDGESLVWDAYKASLDLW